MHDESPDNRTVKMRRNSRPAGDDPSPKLEFESLSVDIPTPFPPPRFPPSADSESEPIRLDPFTWTIENAKPAIGSAEVPVPAQLVETHQRATSSLQRHCRECKTALIDPNGMGICPRCGYCDSIASRTRPVVEKKTIVTSFLGLWLGLVILTTLIGFALFRWVL
jgi:hypothetical protein